MRDHVNNFDHEDSGYALCSVCKEPSYVLLPHDGLSLCPFCAIGYFEIRNLCGIPLINQMSQKYEQIIMNKIGSLLPIMDVKNLTELHIQVALITFAENGRSFQFFHDPKGSLVFLFSNFSPNPNEENVFSTVIGHETSHAYLTHKAKLGITDKLRNRKALTFSQVMAAQLAEDIQLEKVLMSRGLLSVVKDEIDRVSIYFGDVATRPISALQWQTLDENTKLSSMSSITWTYAEEFWLNETLQDPLLKTKTSDNIKLVNAHYSMHGYTELKDLTISMLKEPVCETNEEAERMFARLLKVFDDYCVKERLQVY